MKLQEHKIELIGGIILLLTSGLLPYLGISKDVAWFAAIMSVLLSIVVALIKEHFSTVIRRLISNNQEISNKAFRILAILSELDGVKFQHGQEILENALSEIQKVNDGEIPLDVSAYFHEIIEGMKAAPPDTLIYAVNCIDELRWKQDPREARYLEENKRAIKRGVKINRIFILDKDLLERHETPLRLDIIREQMKNEKINVFVVWKQDLLGQENRIKDWVLFSEPERKLFVDFPDPVDKTRVSHAMLIVDNAKIDMYLKDFDLLAECALSEMAVSEMYAMANTPIQRTP